MIGFFARQARNAAAGNRGQAATLFVVVAGTHVSVVFVGMGIHHYHLGRQAAADAIDAIALSAATWEARGLNLVGALNDDAVQCIRVIRWTFVIWGVLAVSKRELNNTEKETVRKHPQSTIDLLNTIEFAEDVKEAILHHHERYDGTGYPAGLNGSQIPLVSRVISVIDSYRAMISQRSYGRQYTHEEALHDIKSRSGTWYDPEVVEAFEMKFRPGIP